MADMLYVFRLLPPLESTGGDAVPRSKKIVHPDFLAVSNSAASTAWNVPLDE
jgi:hypothetical protein